MELRDLERTFRKWSRKFKYSTLTSKPEWQVAILTCMDTRITSEVFGLEEPGKAIIIRNAGALLTSDSLRSLIVAIYELGVKTIAVVGHTNCGGRMNNRQMEELIEKISKQKKLPQERVLTLMNANTPQEALLGFSYERDQIIETVEKIRNHPLIPNDVQVYGFIYSTSTGSITTLKK